MLLAANQTLPRAPGFYLATAPLYGGVLTHTGIVEVRAGLPPMVWHLSEHGFLHESVAASKATWTIAERIQARDEDVRARIQAVTSAPRPYHVIWNNCEHFTRWVIRGIRESPQLQLLVGITCVVFALGAIRAAARNRRG